jgi:hypothetical protein
MPDNLQSLVNIFEFGFTAMLTFLVPLLIVLFEKRDEFNTLDKKLISQISKIRTVFLSIIITIVSLFTIDSAFSNYIFYTGLGIIILSTIFLIFQTFQILNFILDRDKFRLKAIRKSNDEEVLDYFEEFFLSGKSNLNSRRQNIKNYSKEEKVLFLVVEKINRTDFIKQAEFLSEIVDILIYSLDNINTLNIIKNDLHGNNLITHIFNWHFKAKQAESIIQSKFKQGKINQKQWIRNKNLSSSLNKLILKIQTKSILESVDFLWYEYISLLIKNIEKFIKSDSEIRVKYPDYYTEFVAIQQSFNDNLNLLKSKPNPDANLKTKILELIQTKNKMRNLLGIADN